VIEKIQPKPKFLKTIEADYSAVNFVDDGASYFMLAVGIVFMRVL